MLAARCRRQVAAYPRIPHLSVQERDVIAYGMSTPHPLYHARLREHDGEREHICTAAEFLR